VDIERGAKEEDNKDKERKKNKVNLSLSKEEVRNLSFLEEELLSLDAQETTLQKELKTVQQKQASFESLSQSLKLTKFKRKLAQRRYPRVFWKDR
jgi:hypothetical protein